MIFVFLMQFLQIEKISYLVGGESIPYNNFSILQIN